MVGIVILLHGSGGSADFAIRADTMRVMDTLQKAGYGFFATSSTQRSQPRRWDPRTLDLSDNPDLLRLQRLYKKIVRDKELSADFPLFTMGMSNGANMATTVGYVFHQIGYPIKAVAPYMGGFAQSIIEAGDYDLPTFLVLAENDTLVNNARLETIYQTLKREGKAIERHMAREQQLDRPWLESYGVNDVNRAMKFLQDKNYIDSAGNRRITFDVIEQKGREVFDFPELQDDAYAVRNAVMAAWAFHKMRSDYRDQQLQFFEKFRQQ
ncbi:MAG: dienelactone hydrolase family protein [Pseudomonadales bacterium]